MWVQACDRHSVPQPIWFSLARMDCSFLRACSMRDFTVFTGAPTNRTMYLIVGGVVATLAGLTGLVVSGKR